MQTQTQTRTPPNIATLGESGLPGALVTAHQEARANAPATAQSYALFFGFLDERRHGVPHQTQTVSTKVKYYNDQRGVYKLSGSRSTGRLFFATAIVVLTVLTLFAVPQQSTMAQSRSDPGALLDQAASRIERVVSSAKRLKNALPTRKKAAPAASGKCRSTGNGNTRARRAC